ncbi:MAG: DUF3780 domain-containing protein [Pseudomonadota bacterium]
MAKKAKSMGFGFVPEKSQHHFLVTIPKRAKKNDWVCISEHLEWNENEEVRILSFALGREDSKMRVMLSQSKWSAIADDVKAEFNGRLKRNGLKSGQWKTGQTPVSRLLGKELVLLAWAIEDADPALIPMAIKNWLGLAPEERWWLFTMTNAATGHALTGRDKGWRKAVRYALTENPVSSISYDRRKPRFGLFELMENGVNWGSETMEAEKQKAKK